MKIDRLTIRGFLSIQTLENFPLGDLNVLIGANGAGKSNFVTYFRFLRELAEQRLQLWVKKQGGADRIFTFGVKHTSQISSYIQFGETSYSFKLQPTVTGDLVILGEGGGYIADNATSLKLPSQVPNTSEFEANLTRYSEPIFHALSSWTVYHFHDTSATASLKLPHATHDTAYLRPDGANLAPFLLMLSQKHPAIYQKIRQLVRLVLPFFNDFSLNPEPIQSGEELVRLTWTQRDSDYPFLPSQLSDGSLRFICLATALLQPNPPSTIIIDEPELGLHPYALTLLASLIRSQSTQTQIILSTQSVALVNEFDAENLIIVERENGVSVFKRLDATHLATWLEDYTLGQLWEKNILGGRPTK